MADAHTPTTSPPEMVAAKPDGIVFDLRCAVNRPMRSGFTGRINFGSEEIVTINGPA